MLNPYDPWRNASGFEKGPWDPLPTWNHSPLSPYFKTRQQPSDSIGTSYFGVALATSAALVLVVIVLVQHGAISLAHSCSFWIDSLHHLFR